MKTLSLAILCTAALGILLQSPVAHAAQTGAKKGLSEEKSGVLKEDNVYWSRLMQDTTSVPLAPPCEVEASVTCVNADGTDCVDLPPRREDCAEPITYTFCVENVGPSDMTLDSATVDQNGVSLDVLDAFENTNLAPGEQECVEASDSVDLCTGESVTTTFEVTATPDNGGPGCEDEATYQIEVIPPPDTPAPTPPEPDTPAPTPPEPETPAPTPLPTPEPTVACEINIETGCVAQNGTDCDNLLPVITRCDFRPTEMRFKYNGGNCEQSFNIQGDLFVCFDLDGGPPTSGSSYIVATDVKGNDITYFAGTVEVGEEFTVNDGGNRVDANMNVTIYESEGGPIQQTLIYHSSCSRNLFLKDRFGAVQLTYFRNDQQGEVSCFIPATYSWSLVNTGEVPGLLESLVVVSTPFGTFDLTDAVNGQELEPGDTFEVTATVTLDMTVRQRYTTLTTITGQIPFPGPSCSDSDFYSFVAGNPIQGVPTDAPTMSPTITPSPTVDPETSACALQAGVSCTVSVGPPGSTCENLTPITDTTCIGGNPTELDFKYNGQSCSESVNDQEGFLCEDSNGGPAGAESVFVIVITPTGDFVYYRGVVALGETFSATGAFRDAVTIEVSTVVGDGADAEPGDLLQSMVVTTNCEPEDDLTLGNTFGSLELVGFESTNQGDVLKEASLLITYSVDNPSIAANLNSALSVSSERGEQELIQNPPLTLEFRGRATYTEQVVVNLIEGEPNNPYRFLLTLEGEGAQSGIGCEDEAVLEFSVTT